MKDVKATGVLLGTVAMERWLCFVFSCYLRGKETVATVVFAGYFPPLFLELKMRKDANS